MADKTTEENARYSDAELAEFKKLIDRKIEDGHKNYKIYFEQIQKHTATVLKKKGRDDEKEIAAIERLETMSTRQEKHLQHLEDALTRIKGGDYGVCQETGKLISKERLLAMPNATLSIQANFNGRPERVSCGCSNARCCNQRNEKSATSSDRVTDARNFRIRFQLLFAG